MTNPYQPCITTQTVAAYQVRFVFPATILLGIAIAVAFIDLPGTIGNHFRNGTMQNAFGALMTLLVLAVAIFCSWSEWFGSPRSQRFVTWALVPLALLTALIVYNLIAEALSGITLQQVVEYPSPVLGWLTCPVVWYYFVASLRARWLR